ncbi:MAG: DUF2244 domain-containing protein [Alphaproteobacteria bacterium]|nr:MAG: DUF2244 domain-containing protein [Alphaproteobacteria bacterium]
MIGDMAEEMTIAQEGGGLPLAPMEAALVGPAREAVLYSLVMRPHRSLDAARIREFMMWTVVLFMAFAAHLTLKGAWPAAIWVAASGFGLALALHLSDRQRRRFELLRMGPCEIELVRASPPRRIHRERLPRAWTQVELCRDPAGRPSLFLRHRARRVALGRLLPPDELPALASELRRALARFR